MVLITRYLPKLNEVPPKLDGLNKDQICDVVISSTTIGIIDQLTMLVAHSNNIFKSITEDCCKVTERIQKLSSRIKPLIDSTPSIEDYHRNTSIDIMNSRSRVEFHAENTEHNQHFTHDSIPNSVNDVYQSKCKPPPNLALLDPYMDDNQKSLKLYTNPGFFMEEWIAEQQKQHEEARQRRRERREARLKKKGEKGEANEVKKVKSVTKVRYDPVTGEKITISVESPAQHHQQNNNNNSSPIQSHVPTSSHFGNTNQNYSTPPPPPMHTGNSGNNFPPPPQSTGFSTPPPPISHSNSQSQFSNRPPSTGFNAPPPPIQSSLPNQANPRMSVHNMANAPTPTAAAPPPPPPPPPSAPAPPPPPMMASAGGNSAATTEKPKASGARSDLLSSIMQGIALKPAEERKMPEPAKKEETAALNVADILARRIAWAASDSEDDSDDDSDSDWDD